uniref:Adhesion G protein-coupled receptor B2 n=1 Tax=Ornithorhynchus anatinus TaxID=9258 RepID=F7FFV7_ORNAN
MNPACPLLLSVIPSLLWLTSAFDPAPSACSALASGVLYGSFSLQDLFPTIASGCSWTLENPDPTKYSLYLRFNREEQVCAHFAPMVLPLDHYLANFTCSQDGEWPREEGGGLELCRPRSPFTFLHFDKNFVQLCLSAEPSEAPRLLAPAALQFRFVEVLLINNNNSSQFSCAVLCRWVEECGHLAARGCPSAFDESVWVPVNFTQTALDGSLVIFGELSHKFVPSRCSNLLSEEPEEELKVKTQWPRSADEPGVYMAQTGDPAAEEWSQWSVCSLTCGQGLQVRTRSCVSSPYGTLCSGPLREARTCNNTATCPGTSCANLPASPHCSRQPTSLRQGSGPRIGSVDRGCLMSSPPQPHTVPSDQSPVILRGQQPTHWCPWRGWGCGHRTGVLGCPCVFLNVHTCPECWGICVCPQMCTPDGKWGPWNPWSLCSKTCDTGWQRRFRMCQGTGVQGYPCEGTGEEVKTCNEKKCPAFYEMCKDEYVMLMTWKKTAAGEIIYNKCPPNATGSASRRCLLNAQGVAYWGLPSFARCISHEYRYLHLSVGAHRACPLAPGWGQQRRWGGRAEQPDAPKFLGREWQQSVGVGFLPLSVWGRRGAHACLPSPCSSSPFSPPSHSLQRFFQVVSYMVDAENKEKWDDAQQVTPGSVHLLRVVEDFIHLVGDALKAFQSSLIVTDNLVISIQREPVSAVSSDITFPMRGRRGMKDWARHSEDRLFLPKEVLSLASSEADESSYFVIGAVLYRTLGLILPQPRPPLAVSSRVLTVTVRPPTKPTEPLITVELSYVVNVIKTPGGRDPGGWGDASSGHWDTESCQTLESHAAHTRCQCQQLSTFAVLAQMPKDLTLDPSGTPSVPLMIGCAVSCMALLTLMAVYAAFWRFIKSERSIILLNFCASILASNVLILVGQSQMLSKGACTLTAAFLHFFFLSSFCWVLTEAWQSYLAVIGRIRPRLIRKRFLCLGWGLPALVVAVSVGFTRTKGYGTASYCWLSLEGGLLYAFVGPAAVIVLVNMLIGIIVFNKLMSRDGVSDKTKKQRAGYDVPHPPARTRLLLPCAACGVVPSPLLSTAAARNAMASLWSSCVVLPLLALTWMSAVLAMTDRRSILFQVLFAIFNSAQGFVIVAVHCFLRREVQDVVKCQIGVCKSDENENSPDSCKNGQVQIMSDFEKDVDLACQTVLFKEVNTCNPSTITGTLSRLSLDEDEEPKLHVGSEGSLGFSSLPGNIPPPGILVQGPSPVLGEPARPEDVSPMYMCGEGSLHQLDYAWLRGAEPRAEGDYAVLPRRTLSLKPFGREEGKRARAGEGTPRRGPQGLAYETLQNPYGLHFQPPASGRQAPAPGERSRTMPRTVPGSALKLGSLERKKLRYSDLDFEKVMHTRKRHSELYHELNQKFHTFDHYRGPSTAKVRVYRRVLLTSHPQDAASP